MPRVADDLIAALVKSGPGPVGAYDSLEVLRAWGLPVPDARKAQGPTDAIAAAEEIGYPVAIKVEAEGILHKTDVGGVRLGLADRKGVAKAYDEISSACGRQKEGLMVMVQRMVDPGIEIIVGTKKDQQFGQTIMFGLGGVYVEIFEDVVFGLIPVDLRQARKMISTIKAFPLLKGYRGGTGVDIDFLADLIVSVSDLIHAYPLILEMDLNPVIAYPEGASIVDARMLLGSHERVA